MSEQQQTPNIDTNQIVEERRSKLQAIRSEGQAFPNDFERLHMAQDLQRSHGHKSNEDFDASPVNVAVAGRMMLKRVKVKRASRRCRI